MREGFNFYRSYFDVYCKLSDKDKVAFMDALLNRQFNGVEPKSLDGMADFAYLSQKHSIDRQVKGYEDKTGSKLHPAEGEVNTPTEGGFYTPTEQVQVEGKVQVQVQEKIDFVALQTTYNTICGDKLKECRAISDARKANIRKIVKQIGKEGLMEVFKKAAASKFLTGDNDRNWVADFDFITHPKKAIKIYEGSYDKKLSKAEEALHRIAREHESRQ